jgi:hypothetical protein
MNKVLLFLLVMLVGAQSASALTVQVPGRDTPVEVDSRNFVKYELPGGKVIKAIYYDADNQDVVY